MGTNIEHSNGEPTGVNPPSNLPPEFLAYCLSELTKKQLAAEAEKLRYDAAKKVVKQHRKWMEGHGVDLKTFDFVLSKIDCAPEEVMTDMARAGEYMRALGSPIAHQFDLFEQPGPDMGERWIHDGFKAGLNGEDADSNPHHPNGAGFQKWLDGYQRGQTAILAGMNMARNDDAAPGDVTTEDEQTDIEDAIAKAEPGDVPHDEDSALHGIEG